MNVYLYPSNVETSLKNIYIGEYGWKPGANTVAYYKFDGNLNDSSGNGRNLSWGSSGTFGTTAGGGTYAIFSGGQYTNSYSLPFNTSDYVISLWYNCTANTPSGQRIALDFANGSVYTLRLSQINNTTEYWGSYFGQSVFDGVINTWENVVLTYSNNVGKMYINGVLKDTGSGTFNNTLSLVLGRDYNQSGTTYCANCYLSEMIFESKARTKQEISDYYNQTKANYGL